MNRCFFLTDAFLEWVKARAAMADGDLGAALDCMMACRSQVQRHKQKLADQKAAYFRTIQGVVTRSEGASVYSSATIELPAGPRYHTIMMALPDGTIRTAPWRVLADTLSERPPPKRPVN